MTPIAPIVECAGCGRHLRAKTPEPSLHGPYYYLRRHKNPHGRRCQCDTSIPINQPDNADT
jgi:hypothetical protein